MTIIQLKLQFTDENLASDSGVERLKHNQTFPPEPTAGDVYQDYIYIKKQCEVRLPVCCGCDRRRAQGLCSCLGLGRWLPSEPGGRVGLPGPAPAAPTRRPPAPRTPAPLPPASHTPYIVYSASCRTSHSVSSGGRPPLHKINQSTRCTARRPPRR